MFREIVNFYAGVDIKPPATSTLYSVVSRSSGNITRTPVFLGHSADDDVVYLEHGVVLSESLKGMGFDVEFVRYEEGGHWIVEPQGVDDMVEFITSCIPK